MILIAILAYFIKELKKNNNNIDLFYTIIKMNFNNNMTYSI